MNQKSLTTEDFLKTNLQGMSMSIHFHLAFYERSIVLESKWTFWFISMDHHTQLVHSSHVPIQSGLEGPT